MTAMASERRAVKLKDVIMSINVGASVQKFLSADIDDDSGINYYIRIGDMVDGEICATPKTTVMPDSVFQICRKKSQLAQGDVLFSAQGTIGKVAIVAEEPRNWDICDSIYTIKPNIDLLLPKYLYHLLQVTSIKDGLIGKSVGLIKQLPRSALFNLEFELPDLAEQKRLADMLDTAWEVCNGTESRIGTITSLVRTAEKYYGSKVFEHLIEKAKNDG